jgi:hypothetical protein
VALKSEVDVGSVFAIRRVVGILTNLCLNI